MSVSLRLQGSTHALKLSAEKELGRIIEAVDRLRQSAIINLSEDFKQASTIFQKAYQLYEK